jgi:hypothetical protein
MVEVSSVTNPYLNQNTQAQAATQQNPPPPPPPPQATARDSVSITSEAREMQRADQEAAAARTETAQPPQPATPSAGNNVDRTI